MSGGIRTEQEITRLSCELDPLTALVLEPLQPSVREPIPLFRPMQYYIRRFNTVRGIGRSFVPGPDPLLILEHFMELLTQQMRPFTDDQAPVVRPVRQQIDQTLQTPEPGILGILVLMRPGLVRLDVCSVGEPDIDRVKRDDQVGRVVDLFKGCDHARLLTHRPGEGFMGDRVAQTHALLVDIGQVVFVNGRRVVPVEAQAADSLVY